MPHGWEPITPTGDAIGRQHMPVERGQYRSLLLLRLHGGFLAHIVYGVETFTDALLRAVLLG